MHIMKRVFLSDTKVDKIQGNFYTKLEANSNNIVIIENCKITNEFTQNVCLPYFKDLYKVTLPKARRT